MNCKRKLTSLSNASIQRNNQNKKECISTLEPSLLCVLPKNLCLIIVEYFKNDDEQLWEEFVNIAEGLWKVFLSAYHHEDYSNEMRIWIDFLIKHMNKNTLSNDALLLLSDLRCIILVIRKRLKNLTTRYGIR